MTIITVTVDGKVGWNITRILHCLCTGHSCGQHENPADFILDVLTLCEKGICNVDEIKVDLGRLLFYTHRN